MSPQSFACWLAGRRWLWFPLPGLRPAPEQRFPVSAVVLAALLGAGLAAGAVAGLLSLAATPLLDKASTTATAAEFGGIAGLWIGLFAMLCWNQRAARLRGAAPSEPLRSPGVLAIVFLGPPYLFVLGVVVPWMLFVGVENVRGALRWRAVRTALEARGEPMRVADLLPKPAPDDGNLGALPLFADLLNHGRASRPGEPRIDTNAMARFDVFRLPDAFLPKEPQGKGRPPEPSLETWADAFRAAKAARTSAKPRDRQAALALPDYGTIPDGVPPAQAILAALKVADADVETVKAAARRPRAVFPVRWEEGFETLLPHLAQLKRITLFLDFRCRVRLEAGDTAGAFDDALGAVNLANALREEPVMISQLVQVAQASIAARAVRRGLEAHAWTDAQWAELQAGAGAWHPIPSMMTALRGERVMASMILDRWAASPRRFAQEWENLGGDRDAFGNEPSRSPMGMLMPSGWIRNAQAAIVTYEQGLVDDLKPAAEHLPADGLAPVIERTEGSFHRMTMHADTRRPGEFLVRMLAPAVGRAVLKAAHGEHVARCTEVACALERHRIAHGAYPESLSALVPRFLPTAPLDVMNGKPLRYTVRTDGTFRLSSAGLPTGNRFDHPSDAMDWNWP